MNIEKVSMLLTESFRYVDKIEVFNLIFIFDVVFVGFEVIEIEGYLNLKDLSLWCELLSELLRWKHCHFWLSFKFKFSRIIIIADVDFEVF